MNAALVLLLVTGGLLGLTLPFGKIAGAAGVTPMAWAFLISAGAGGLLALWCGLRGLPLRLEPARLRYYAIAGGISFALPNALMFLVMPHLGAGYVGILFTLSPVMTLALSILFRVRRPSRLGMAGIAVGFVGAGLVAATRGELGRPADPVWVVVGVAMTACLATGNIYRSLAWPRDADPVELAAGSHLAAAGLLLAGLAVSGQAGALAGLAAVPVLAAVQALVSALLFVTYFRLQVVGGPVYLSQIGYVAAAVGLASGILFLGESYGPQTWIGAAIIALGVTLTTRAQSTGRG